MTLDMEVPLMPGYIGGTHPLKLLGNMSPPPSAVPTYPSSTSSRASSASPPQEPGPRTGFSIADILKPNFGSKGGKDDGPEADYEPVKERDFEQEDMGKDQSIFKAESLKERLKLPTEIPLTKHVMDPTLGSFGVVAPKALHGLPSDISPAYYQSYILYQQKYADYMHMYGQPGLLPFQVPPAFPNNMHSMKNQLQLAHEQMLVKHKLNPLHVRGAPVFPESHSHTQSRPVVGHQSLAKTSKPHSTGILPHGHPHRAPPAQHFPHHARPESRHSPQASSTPSPRSYDRSFIDHHQQQHIHDKKHESFEHPKSTVSSPSPSSPRSPALTSPSGSGPEALKGRGEQSPDSTSQEGGRPQGGSGKEELWPAWVYCTRYSDRPSSGPRSRKMRRKDKNSDEKRPRTAFTNEQLDFLRREFEENKYLTEERRQRLSKELSLTESQIKIWFQNKRAKLKKSTGNKNPLALSLMAQGLYNHASEADDSASASGHGDE